ncbi:serine hydrolase [Actinomadura rubrisoli]|uniref:serine hydrolase n=1 Tax=Actinomadura rubrisoli TaxID=2530368 RepID=UPI001A9DCB65|nr:serine hydrolase domain-containing protein [Actinomadura rubrisoli]
MAVAHLVQRGKAAFHATLGTYLDGFPPEIADTVTAHHLLIHTSGMGDYSESPEFREGQKRWKTAAEVMDGGMAVIRRSPLRFTPGTRHEYKEGPAFPRR